MKPAHTRPNDGAAFGNETDTEGDFEVLPAAPKLIVEWLVESKIRGERGKQIYLARQYEFVKDQVLGAGLMPSKAMLHPELNRWTERELVHGRKVVRKLKEALEVRQENLTVIENTPMNLLLAALGKAIFERKDDCPDGM
jgi:hypothetical protein